jgi:hypothetical protein
VVSAVSLKTPSGYIARITMQRKSAAVAMTAALDERGELVCLTRRRDDGS